MTRAPLGFICMGAPIGTDKYVEATMDFKVEELRDEVKKVEAVLGEDKQGLWTILRSSFAHKLEYWLAMLHPSQVKKAAREVDKIFHSVLEKVTGSHLPQQPGALTCPCCPTVEGLNLDIPGLPTTFQQLTASLPLKLGGLGLRSQEILSPYAYYGGLEQSLPYFSTVCPPLAHLYEPDQGVDSRWEPLLTSGTRTGRELAAALDRVKEEANSLAAFLEKEVPTHLSSEPVGMGAGKVDGSIRALLVKEAEKLRAAALDKALEDNPGGSSSLPAASPSPGELRRAAWSC